jgi:hypothetical protein
MNSRRRPARAWLPAVAAAAAVCLIAGLSVAVANGHRSPRPASASDLALRSVPDYYAALVRSKAGSGVFPEYAAAIRDTRTGATIVTAPPPAGFSTFSLVSAAANDRTFVLVARVAGRRGLRTGAERLFLAQFSPSRRTLVVAPLAIPLPASQKLGGIALSPRGTELALAVLSGPGDGDLEVSVIPLAGGAPKIWTAAGGVAQAGGASALVSVAWGPGRSLAVRYSPAGVSPSVRLLNTDGAGGSLIADSRLVMHGRHGWSLGAAVLSGNGNRIVVTVYRVMAVTVNGPGPHPLPPGYELQEYAATGKLVRVITAIGMAYWSNSGGSVLIVLAGSGQRATLAVLSGRRLTPLPGSVLGIPGLAF